LLKVPETVAVLIKWSTAKLLDLNFTEMSAFPFVKGIPLEKETVILESESMVAVVSIPLNTTSAIEKAPSCKLDPVNAKLDPSMAMRVT